ncbi:ectoine hydrolase DoeA [Malaciobacter canalis]|uniref:Ectoine hydrolase DoeA n=1 Tax=Malaciobacter canalis TaxID=1912871 RepID=A0ABX4LX89_9BACT|nr:M24 family metallopeptidase [Malaciobacter canalis]PHO11084.1 ectoine hydrolase DoeA [Malaciobacter canalis]QEE33167.1 ectoine hydrolase [Malaciobacter canalis]
MKLAFPKAEYVKRVKKVQREMRRKGIDVLLATDPGNMNWLTGYDGWSFYVHQGVIVSLDEEEPIWFGRAMDRSAALLRCYMKDDKLVAYPEEYVQNLDKHPMEWLAKNIFFARGWHDATIATEMDNYYYSAQAHLSLVSNLWKARFVDSQNLVNWARCIKSEKEIEYMKIAGRITSKIHQRILDVARVGIPKSFVVAQIYETAIEGVDGYSGDYPSIVPLLPSGKEASASHITWDNKPFKSNEGTFFEVSGCYKRYHCPMSRTVYMGKPSERFLNAEKALLEAIDTGLEQAKPGNKASDIAKALDKVMLKYGIDRHGARCGYPIGVSYPPDWGERTFSIRASDNTILKSGMTFHFMPGIWQEDWGIEITESILITDTGYESLCDYPRKLFFK